MPSRAASAFISVVQPATLPAAPSASTTEASFAETVVMPCSSVIERNSLAAAQIHRAAFAAPGFPGFRADSETLRRIELALRDQFASDIDGHDFRHRGGNKAQIGLAGLQHLSGRLIDQQADRDSGNCRWRQGRCSGFRRQARTAACGQHQSSRQCDPFQTRAPAPGDCSGAVGSISALDSGILIACQPRPCQCRFGLRRGWRTAPSRPAT